jgi:hypothetical protein
MTKMFLSILPILFFAIAVNAQDKEEKMRPHHTEFWDPEVEKVTPGERPQDAPSDAIVLFDGTQESFNHNWVNGDGNPSEWKVKDNCVTVKKRAGGIKSKMEFGDIQLHIEWRTPEKVKGESQGRGNSGIFLQGKYELQVLDNYENRTYRNGQAGSIYKQHPPLVNVCKGPGEWQTYDIIYTAPRFREDGTVFTPAAVTVLQNGVLVQNNSKLLGPTMYVGIPQYRAHGKASITIQDHGNPVSYRNIWIREL